MQDWNTVITVSEGGFRQAIRALEDFGPVKRTEFFNVLVLQAYDIFEMLEDLRSREEVRPEALSSLSRVVPAQEAFTFHSADEFEEQATRIVLGMAQRLAGKSFHVRIRRRGFKGRLSSHEEEKVLDTAILDALEKAGTPARISFQDPDAVIAVETVGTRAGISLFTREDLQRYRFIRPD